MNYTVLNDTRINTKIDRDLESLKQLLLDELSDIEALVLVGGFGRGEGSAVYLDNEPVPLNDYDLVVIANKSLDAQKRKRISSMAAKMVGIPHVDLAIIPRKQLEHLPNTMFNYDLKYGGYVFHGPSNILSFIPNLQSSEIPLKEGGILLFNRLICMLECFSTEFLNRPLMPQEQFFLVNQTGKAILACCDALLLLKEAYDHSYQERARRFKNLYSNNSDVVRLVQKATDFKLMPTKDNHNDCVDYWLQVRRVYEATFRDFMGRLWRREFHHWSDLADQCSLRVSSIKKFVRTLMPAHWCRNHYLKEAQIMTLFGFDEEGVDDVMLEKAQHYLNCAYNENGTLLWERLRKEIVHRYYQANY